MDRYYIYLCRPRVIFITNTELTHRFLFIDFACLMRELFRLISVVSLYLSTGKCLLFRMHR